jgi:proteic killer suppression protein
MMINRVEISGNAENDLRSIPFYLAEKLEAWVGLLRATSVEKARSIPGFHDEPLQGKRFGQRSIRLNHAYRAIYRICHDEVGKFILIEEVNKHDY